MTSKPIVVVMVLLIVCLFLIVSNVFAFDFEAKIQELLNENVRIDQIVIQRKQEIGQLTQRKLENIGAVKVLQEVEREEKKIEVEEKSAEVEDKKVVIEEEK